MDTLLHSKHNTARLAAAIFLLGCVPLSIWDQSYVSGMVFVALDPVATSNNMLANEFMFRTAIVTHLAGMIAFAAMIFMFARVFEAVDSHLSRLMRSSVMVSVTAVLIFEAINFTALMALKSDPRPAFEVAQQKEVAYFILRMSRYALGPGFGKLFLGLCFIPFAMLILRSGYAPKFVGVLMLIGGVGYVGDFCIAVLLQRADYIAVRQYSIFTTGFYMLAFIWFLVKGVSEPKTAGVS